MRIASSIPVKIPIPVGVQVIGAFNNIVGAVGVVMLGISIITIISINYVEALFPFGHRHHIGEDILLILLFGLSVLCIFAGNGLLKGKNWARIAEIILASLGVLSSFILIISGPMTIRGKYSLGIIGLAVRIIWGNLGIIGLAVSLFIGCYILLNKNAKSFFKIQNMKK